MSFIEVAKKVGSRIPFSKVGPVPMYHLYRCKSATAAGDKLEQAGRTRFNKDQRFIEIVPHKTTVPCQWLK